MMHSLTSLRHLEVAAKRPSKETAPESPAAPFEARASRGHLRVTGLALALAAAIVSPAHAQSDYPNKAITLVVPLPPGGTNDIMARAVADRMSAALGQQVVVENRAAGG